MAIIAVPQLSDNYAYLVVDDASKECGVVDCSEAGKVLAEVKRQDLKLVAVLPTHWHFDHVGGNEDLARAIPGIRVYGARNENGRIPAQTNGHVAYHFPQLDAVFTGDTLFIAGCGRVFEGKANTMVESLRKLAALPDSTKVYCGHEYTAKNLQFALTLEPNNAALKAKNDWVIKERAAGKFTVPSTIGEEKQINPFLRTESVELRASLKKI